MSFRICSYNMGYGLPDYLAVRALQEGRRDFFTSREEAAAYEATDYVALQHRTASKIYESEFDVVCLQEVGDENRPMIAWLRTNGYQIVHTAGDRFDTAIAVNPKRFKILKNHSREIDGQDVAIATVQDLKTKKTINFVSAHAPGFDFSDVRVEDTQIGNVYCEAILATLAKIKSTTQVIGADMNANPEICPERFAAFHRAKFAVLRTNLETNVNPRDVRHTLREIDFIFARGLEADAAKPLFGFNNECVSGDHLPVEVTLK